MYEDFNCKLFANRLNALSDRQVLETMLCNVASREEIDAITRKVGSSFIDIMNLGYERLTYLDTATHKTVCYLEYLREFAARYLASSYINSINMKLDTSEKLCEYFRRLFIGIDREEVHAVGLDDNLKFVCREVVLTGTPDYVGISMRRVSEFIILNNLTRIVFAHNHPQGHSYPSDNDITNTKDVVHFLMRIDVEVIDHIIIGIGNAFSFKSSMCNHKVW